MANPDEPIPILLVDDREENLLALEAVLESREYHLVKARSGEEALGALLKYDFAAILLDVQMPELSGFDTAVLIKQREKSKEIPIIFITAIYPDEFHRNQGYQVGGTEYLVKPFEPNVLRAKVATFAGLHRRKREAERQRAHHEGESERRLAEFKTKSEERFRDLVEHLDHAIVWIASAETFRFSFVASQAEWLLGYPVRDWLEDPEFIKKHVYPEDQDLLFSTLEKARRGGKETRCEHRMITQDGRVLWFQSGMHLIQSGDAGPELRGVCVEITPFKKTEEALKQSEQRYEFALRAGKIGVWEMDLNSPLITWSKRQFEIFGVDPNTSPLTYQVFLETVHPEDRPKIEKEYKASIYEKRDFDLEYRILWRGDGIRWVKANGQISYDRDGKPLRMMGTNVDITDRKEAEEALKRAHDELESKVQERTEFIKAVLDNLEDGIVACDAKGQPTLLNRAIRETHGLSEIDHLLPEQWSSYFDIYEPDGKTPMPLEKIPLFRALKGIAAKLIS